MTVENTQPFQFGTEIRFALRDSSYPIVRISERLGCRIEVLESVRSTASGDQIIQFLRIASGDGERIRSTGRACEWTDEVRIYQADQEQALVELTVDNCLVQAVADTEGILTAAHATDGRCEVDVFLPPDRQPGDAIDAVTERHPQADVAALNKRPIAAPLLSKQNFDDLLRELLTERQWEVLRIAHDNGYFERPRDIHQRQIAAELDITQETVSQHLRAAQRRLLSTVFEDVMLDSFDG